MPRPYTQRLNNTAAFLKRYAEEKNKIGFAATVLRNYSERVLLEILPHLRRSFPRNNPVFGDAFPVDFSRLCVWEHVYAVPSVESELLFSAAEIRIFSDLINKFIQYETSYYRHVINRRFSEAATILDHVEAELGVSLWLLENRLALLEFQTGVDTQKTYAQNIKATQNVSPAIKTIIYFFSLKAEKTVSPARYRQNIAKTFPSSRDLEGTSAAYLRFTLGFYCDSEGTSFDTILAFGRKVSLIDRYLTFLRLGQLTCVDTTHAIHKVAFARALKIVDQKVLDNRLESLALKVGIASAIRKSYATQNNENAKLFLGTLDFYTQGDYAAVVNTIPMVSEQDYLGLFDVYGRAIVRGNIELVAGHEYSLLAEDYISLLRKDKDCLEAADSLIKLVYIFSHAPWAGELYGQLAREMSAMSAYFHAWAQGFGDLNGSAYSPRLHIRLISPQGVNSVTGTLLVAQSLTYKFLATAKKTGSSLSSFSEMVPEGRLRKFKARALVDAGEIESAIGVLESSLTDGDTLDRQKAITTLISLHLEWQNLPAAVHLAAHELTENPQMQLNVQLGEILFAFDELRGSKLIVRDIYLAACFGLYSDLYDNDRDEEITIICDELLTSAGRLRPSELVDIVLGIEASVLIYFLYTVCTPDRLDSHTTYASSLEIESERIAILQWLISLDEKNRALYAAEIAQITRRQMIRKGVQTVEKSKIFVDIGGIKNSLIKDFTDLYARFRSLPRMPADLEEMVLQLQRDVRHASLMKLILPANERLHALGQLYVLVRNKFVSSNEYGLDVYLSVGIRHGTLSGQLRSVLERAKLVTHRDKENGYAANEYWTSNLKAEGCDESEVEQINLLLSEFSEKTDSLIAALRDQWVQIRTEDKNYDGRFNFTATKTDVKELDSLISADATPVEALDIVIDQLWKKTDASLEIIRRDLKTVYKTAFSKAIEMCVNALSSMPCQAKTQRLRSTLTMARTDGQNEIDNISTWFTRQSEANVPPYELAFAIDVAVEMVSRCYPSHQLNLIRLGDEISGLRGVTLKGLVDLLFIVFDNMLKHCKKSNGEIVATLNCKMVSNGIEVEVDSTRYEEVDVDVENAELSRKRTDVIAGGVSDRVRGEGGTGFYKIAKIVRFDFRSELNIDFLYTSPTNFKFKMHLLTEALRDEDLGS